LGADAAGGKVALERSFILAEPVKKAQPKIELQLIPAMNRIIVGDLSLLIE